MRDSKVEHQILTEIDCGDGMGGRIHIKALVLLSIFQSEELQKKYKEDPHKKYTVKDILALRNKAIPVKEPTIRNALAENKTYFETTKDIEVRGNKGNKTVMIVNFTKFKPITKYIFEHIEKEWKNQEEIRKTEHKK